MDFTEKRGGTKKAIFDAFLNYYDLLNAGVPGVTLEAIKEHIEEKNYFLYEDEVKAFLEKKPEYQTQLFGQLLEGALAPGSPKKGIGGGGVARNSVERAKQVVNHPEDPAAIQHYVQLMTQAEEIRSAINKMCSDHAKLDFALKNKKAVKVSPDPVTHEARAEGQASEPA